MPGPGQVEGGEGPAPSALRQAALGSVAFLEDPTPDPCSGNPSPREPLTGRGRWGAVAPAEMQTPLTPAPMFPVLAGGHD